MADKKKAPLVVLGKVNTILKFGPMPMQKRQEWQQSDSDTLAQFIDVAGCISRSSWRNAKLMVGISNPATSELPSHEMLIFVAVYFRQLFGGDGLIGRAKNCHNRFTSSSIRRDWVAEECKAALDAWKEVPLAVTVYNYKSGLNGQSPSLEELFNAFLYGAYAFHSLGKVDIGNVETLRQLLKTYPQNILLGGINGGLAVVENHVAALAAAIYQDYKRWFHEESLPPPNIFWQNQLFNAASDSNPLLA